MSAERQAITDLTAERDQLRAALEQIASFMYSDDQEDDWIDGVMGELEELGIRADGRANTVPAEVQERLAELEQSYRENRELQEFHIVHLYPEGLAYPDGFHDSQFFRLVGFNTDSNERTDLGTHDGLRFESGVELDISRVFADGSTLLRFRGPVRVARYQEAVIAPVVRHEGVAS